MLKSGSTKLQSLSIFLYNFVVGGPIYITKQCLFLEQVSSDIQRNVINRILL